MDLAHPQLRFALIGGAVALAAGGIIAALLVVPHRGERAPPPPASRGGLVIDPSATPAGKIDAAKPLRCFVDGKFVGELALAECAHRNGVATDALVVATNGAGALTASQPPPVTPAAPPLPVQTPVAAQASTQAACWTYAAKTWRKLPSETSLNGCVQALFAGRCEPAGGATYGRWGQQTLRLVPGKVEISPDDRSFRTLAEQGTGCSVSVAG